MDVRAGMLQHVAFLTAGPPTLLYTGGTVGHFLVMDKRSELLSLKKISLSRCACYVASGAVPYFWQ